MARPTSPAETSSGTSLILKLSAIVLILVVAGYLAWRSYRPASEQLDTAESASPYICAECGHVAHLTPADYERAINTPREARGEQEPVRGRSSGLICDQCGKPAMFLGIKCPKDGTAVPKRTREGQPGKCSKCGWVYTPSNL